MNPLIRNTHTGNALTGGVTKLTATPSTVASVLAELREWNRDLVGAGEGAGVERLQLFAERHMDLRDDLAWRAARGERLNVRERALLEAFDAILDRLMPSPTRVPPDVRQVMDDVLRTM